MSGENDTEEGTEQAADEDPVWERETAPQSPYTSRDVLTGFVVLAVGAVVAFGLPLALLSL